MKSSTKILEKKNPDTDTSKKNSNNILFTVESSENVFLFDFLFYLTKCSNLNMVLKYSPVYFIILLIVFILISVCDI